MLIALCSSLRATVPAGTIPLSLSSFSEKPQFVRPLTVEAPQTDEWHPSHYLDGAQRAVKSRVKFTSV